MAITYKNAQIKQKESRFTLGAKLFDLKTRLSTSGRGDSWTVFLTRVAIPKHMADRYVENYGSTQEIESISSRIKKLLFTFDSRQAFFDRLAT